MKSTDRLSRFTFSNSAYRGEIVVLDESFNEVLHRYDYPKSIATLLGESLAAIALISATIQFRGKASLQLQGGKHLPLLFVEANHLGQLRGLAHWQGDVEALSFQELTEDGILAINLMPEKTNSYQGIVALESSNLASCLNQYFKQSEQLTTGFWLKVENQKAAGLFLQEFPEASVEEKQLWPELELLATTVSTTELIELPPEELLSRLFAEHDIQLFEASTIEFNCSCSEQKAFNSVMMLGEDEIKDLLLSQGKIDSNCEFCNAEYSFDEKVLLNRNTNHSEKNQNTH